MCQPKRSFIFAVTMLVTLGLSINQPLTSTETGKNMSELPKEIFRNWVHSFEEDTDDITVYRTSTYAFPPARGRAAIGFQPDGAFTDWAIAPADGNQPISGHWRIEASGHVHISFEDQHRVPWVLEIVYVDTEILKVRRRRVSP